MVTVKKRNTIVKVIADSVSEAGVRLTTLECDYPRYVHAHLMTHRMLSKNAQSSRAVPTITWIKQLYTNPVKPLFNKNKSGMQGSDDLNFIQLLLAKVLWSTAKHLAVFFALLLHWVGIHKQVTNRLLEPFQKVRVVISATEWDNFFKLRIHEDAQPEIRELAQCIYEALSLSKPKQNHLHLPYLDTSDYTNDEIIYSVARCAQVSYRKDTLSRIGAYRIFLKLAGSEPIHASPMEHIAFDIGESSGNYTGWKQLRHSEDSIGSLIDHCRKELFDHDN